MEKVWLKNYQEGVPYEINPEEYTSLVSLFDEACSTHAEKIAYVNLSHELTYADLSKKSKQFAAYLQRLGLKKGSRVALMMPNILQYPIALFGTLKAGMVVVNTNPLYTADEVMHQVNNAGAEVIVVLANFANTIEKALPHTSLKHVIVTQIGDCLPFIKGSLVNFVVKYIKKMVPTYHLPHAINFKTTLSEFPESTFQAVPLNHQDTAFLQYTGGTTGVAKAAILTHGNMTANVLQAYYWILPLNIGSQDTIVTALPLYHIFSLTANCLTFLKAGAKNILITNPRDLNRFIDDIKDSQFTAITGVNTLFNALLNHSKFKSIDFSKVKLALSGGMALQKSVAQRWQEQTNTPLIEAYGLTETCPAVTINPMYVKKYNESIGLPLSSTDISIRDDDENELPIGEIGELCVKGPQVMAGYWQRTHETDLVMTADNFLKTGDIARVDDNGYVYLVDRKKDMIIVSGFNVYPNEVEQIIGMLPGVLEVGVIGVNHDISGERIKACIVKKDEALTKEEIITHCRQYLTAYKIPKIVEFYKELPKSNVGKILRRALK